MPDIALMGAQYSDVPAIDLPLVGGGFARFTYGGGGGLNYDTGTFTLAEDVRSVTNPGISHNLGEVPKCIVVWTDSYDTEHPPTAQVNVGYIWIDHIIDMDQRLTSSASNSNGLYINLNISANATVIAAAIPTSMAYAIQDWTRPTSTVFYLPDWGANNRYRSGITYHYFVSEAWWTV